MADTDLIAWVYPYEDLEYRYAQATIEASSQYMPPRVAPQEPPEIHWSRGARESTEPPERNANKDDNLDTLPYLELRFSDVPRTSLGLVFGVDNTCDIALPQIPGISKRHFALTYKNKFEDGYHRLIVRDLGSTFGTAVTYDDKGDELRSKFDWIIDGFRATDKTKKIIVQPHEGLKFRIVVARHDITSPAYIDNVERFRQGAAAAEELLHCLGFQSGPETERNTGAHTPVKNRILLPRGRIAKGGFGVVSHHWNVSTGEEYACKKPAERRYDRKAWEKEIDIMRSISHINIVRLCFWEKEPVPLLALEYMPFGNLEDEHRRARFLHEECWAILHQSLSALAYLHGLPQPVIHRDIKPENILVKYRDTNPDYLHVKLSDFGLSKVGSLKTFCGSQTYCPPEIQDDDVPQAYTKAVDIWSLGVVILRFAYSLPHPGSGFGKRWCRKIVEEASSWDSEGLIDILQRMLVIEAEARYSAAACLRETSRLLTSSGDRSATPTPASYAAGYGPAIAYVSPGGQGEEEQETLRILPHEVCSVIRLREPSLIDLFFSNTFLNMTTVFLVTPLLLIPNGSDPRWTRIRTPCTRLGETSGLTPRRPNRRNEHPPPPERGSRGHPSHLRHPVEDAPSDTRPAVNAWNCLGQGSCRIQDA
ncbi:kinase-like domain-containing protein [Diaporthe sp. PMI_573]|nr:kinase-like domain-containing protein [Diaporthaceae sp. PMI_573]